MQGLIPGNIILADIFHITMNPVDDIQLFSIPDAQRVVKTDSEGVIVLKVSAEVVNVLVLLQIGNVILMSAEIAGSG